jgi:hypothetical protein
MHWIPAQGRDDKQNNPGMMGKTRQGRRAKQGRDNLQSKAEQ